MMRFDDLGLMDPGGPSEAISPRLCVFTGVPGDRDLWEVRGALTG